MAMCKKWEKKWLLRVIFIIMMINFAIKQVPLSVFCKLFCDYLKK